MQDDDLSDAYAGAAWRPLFDATTPIAEVERLADEYTREAVDALRFQIHDDPDLPGRPEGGRARRVWRRANRRCGRACGGTSAAATVGCSARRGVT